ncbi:ubiquitin-2 like rad60 SUMO-like domain-containing protein [Hirsutella rhossiliensis]|uniref:Ubiquitin-2 like rad60 SUMO-like domain-containing protein n=1 Tax=Hirsutella rhossiliensis TaxID=111463 RepID=A0A9P8MY39_9HYPO|nr:ubiquitin-2 like rad60 SUMO-like domain-containing protein [Hirsutella rhossiliensis]KAH0963400.1 ubiquitin-2 like rad60 SUMO-like domain-containing protein [Hirsutella rhossiliensis]
MKKLPFKPTALRKPSLPRLASSEDDSKGGDNDDGLALFRRSKEMEPIMAADRERRMRKKQKQDDERRRQSALLAKRSRDDDDDDDEDSLDGPHDDQLDFPEQPPSARDQSMPAVDLCRPENGEDGFSELVTPPASKRSRTESTQSKMPSLGSDEADLVMEDSPSKRPERAQSHFTTPSNKSKEIAAAPPSAQATAVVVSPSTRRGRSLSHGATPSNKPEIAAAPNSAQAIPPDSEDDDDDDSADEDDEVQIIDTPPIRRRSGAEITDTASVPSPPPADDDEFGEYVRRAEEQHARDRALLGSGADKGQGRETVDILVTSTVPNAGPCRMKYLFDKPLRVVRDSWVAVQRRNGVQLPLQHDDDVILTWRRKKVFIFSTLLNLGIRPQGDGRIQVDGHGREGLADSRTRVHMEAWTPELFQEMEQQEELRRKREAGELSESEDEAADESPTPEVKIRVILKARGLEDVKLTVRPETTVETLVVGFRTQRSIGSDKAVSVVFEGERLEEHVTMEDADIADMDLIDVHIK